MRHGKFTEKLNKAEKLLRQFPQGIRAVEFARKLGVHRTAAYDYLNALEVREKAFNEHGLWFPKDHRNAHAHETREDYEIALKHSQKLLVGLDAILAEELSLCLDLPHTSANVEFEEYQREGLALKVLVEEHLKIGYPHIHGKLMEFREALYKLQELKRNQNLRDVFSHAEVFREDLELIPQEDQTSTRLDWLKRREDLPPTPQPIKRIREQRAESFQELADYFFDIALRVKMGEPLLGSCRLCPEVHIIRGPP